MKKYTIIRVGNDDTSFDVIGATVSIGTDKGGHYVTINGKKIYGLHYAEVIREEVLLWMSNVEIIDLNW